MKLPSWKEFAAEDPLDDTTYKQMVLGVSTRNYERSLDELLIRIGWVDRIQSVAQPGPCWKSSRVIDGSERRATGP